MYISSHSLTTSFVFNHRGRLFSDTLDSDHHERTHHDRDDSNRGVRRCKRSPSTPSSREDYSPNHWTKELMKLEEKDPSRWGHTGYKELYPADFTIAPKEDKRERDGRHKKKKSVKRRRKKHDIDSEDNDGTPSTSSERKKRKHGIDEKRETVRKRKSRKRGHSLERKKSKQKKKKKPSSPIDSSDHTHSSVDHTHSDSDSLFYRPRAKLKKSVI